MSEPIRRIVALLLIAIGLVLPVYSRKATPPPVGGDAFLAPAASDVLVVDFRDGIRLAEVEAEEAAVGIDLDWSSLVSEDEALRSGTVRDRALGDAALARLRADPDVEAAEWAVPMEALGYPNDPLYGKQWNFPHIGVERGWRAGGGKGVVVAVIDTGVSVLPDLPAERLLPGRSFVPGTTSSADDQGHGSHVAGTIAQATNNGVGTAGIAPNATILPLKVLGADGSGRSDWIAAAIDEAVDQGAQVINLSLGGGHSDVLVKAVEKARAAGVVVVAAAGNAGREGLGSPADAEAALGVSATGPDDALAPYSSWGQGVEISAPGGNKNLPGGGILQATIGDRYEEWQGTSMATPHVAGAAAVLFGAGAGSADEVERILKLSAVPMGDEKKFGAGRLDVGAAVARLFLERGGMLAVAGGLVSLALAVLGGLHGVGRVATVALGATFAGGLFFLPFLPLEPSATLSLLARPVMAWPPGSWAGFPLWQACFWPLGAAILLGGSRLLGPVMMALCAGTGAWLLHGASTGSTEIWWMPLDYDRLWLLVHGSLCLVGGLGVAGMQKMRRRTT